MTNSEYNDVQKILDSQTLDRGVFSEAATRILEELDARGFTVEEPLRAVGLTDKITDIILETVRGNTNYCVTSEGEDRTSQSPCDENPLKD